MEKQDILDKLFSGEKKLPTLPVIFDKLNQMLKDPNASNKQIADLMMKDQAMVIKVLKMCNSAMYSTRKEITNLPSAIAFLGIQKIKTLLLQVSLVKTFEIKDNDIPEFDIATFWEHSLGTAYFANIIVKKLGLLPDDNYYLAGLLHDIGKLIIYQFYPNEFKAIVKKQIKTGQLDTLTEEEVLGVNHNEIGGYLAEKWNFSPEIITAIREHHTTSAETDNLLVSVVQVANLFAKTSGLCFPWDHQLFAITGDANWDVIAKNSKNVDTDALVEEILGEFQVIKDSVRDLLQ
ncbi:MAG: HDOD domain-containing protein [Candidatus Omnitrophota bacterium]